MCHKHTRVLPQAARKKPELNSTLVRQKVPEPWLQGWSSDGICRVGGGWSWYASNYQDEVWKCKAKDSNSIPFVVSGDDAIHKFAATYLYQSPDSGVGGGKNTTGKEACKL